MRATERIEVTESTRSFRIGYTSENNVTLVAFDISPQIAEFGDGRVELLIEANGSGEIYPVPVEINGTWAEWLVQREQIPLDGGRCQLSYFSAGDAEKKTTIYSMSVKRSIGANVGDVPPESGWVEVVVNAAARAEQAAADASASADEAKAARDDLFAQKGQPDGIAPLGPDGKVPDKYINGETGKAYIDQQDAATLESAKVYADGKLITIDVEMRGENNFWTDPPTTGQQIIDMVNAGKEVRLHFFDTITNTGDQLYAYETTTAGVPYFRRNVVKPDGVSRINIGVQYNGEVKFTDIPYEPPVMAVYATCNAEAAPITSAPVTWYVPKTMPKPSGKPGMLVDVFWKNGRTDGIGYDIRLVWGAPDAPDNVEIVGTASTTDSLTGEYSIPAEGTVRYQLEESNGRKHWRYVSGPLIGKQFSCATDAATADKIVPGMSLSYLPGMEVYVQLDAGNTADLMRIVPDDGPTLPVYGNGTGTKTGTIPAGYILHLVNAGDHWQIINAAPKAGGGTLEKLTFTGAATGVYDGTAPLTVDIPMGTDGHIYGVRFDTLSNSGSTVHRLYDAQGLVAGVGTDTETARNDFDNVLPFSGMRRCCGEIARDGSVTVKAYKGEPGYAQDGSAGEVFVEIPLFWYKHTYEGTGEEILISPSERPGWLPSPVAVRQGSPEHPAKKAYIPAYRLKMVDGKPTSRSGVFSDWGSLNWFMQQTKDASAPCAVTTAAEFFTLYLLMTVEFATRDTQSVMRGYVSMPYDAKHVALLTEPAANRIVITDAQAASYAVGQTIGIGGSLGSTSVADNRLVTAIEAVTEGQKAIVFDGPAVNITTGNIVFSLAAKNGSCDAVLASSGSPVSNSDGKHDCVYRGIETPYGSAFAWCADLFFWRVGEGTAEAPYAYEAWYLDDLTKYAGGTITSDYAKLSYNIPPKDGYGTRLGFDPAHPEVRAVAEVGASTTTGTSDYYYYPRNATCAARLGGCWSLGSSAGPSCWSCFYAPSDGWIYYRARLSVTPGAGV